jgi:hypothetical protein
MWNRVLVQLRSARGPLEADLVHLEDGRFRLEEDLLHLAQVTVQMNEDPFRLAQDLGDLAEDLLHLNQDRFHMNQVLFQMKQDRLVARPVLSSQDTLTCARIERRIVTTATPPRMNADATSAREVTGTSSCSHWSNAASSGCR